MNAIVPRQTIEDIVRHYDQTLALYKEAFEKIREADRALKAASAEWELAAPGKPSRIYDSSSEIKAFRDAVQLPDEASYMQTAKRLVSITVWEHVIRMTKIESLMDSKETKKLEDQMRYKQPRFSSAGEVIDALASHLEWFQEEAGAWRVVSTFIRKLKDLATDEETVAAMTPEQDAAVSSIVDDMIAAIRKSTERSNVWITDITAAHEELKAARATPRGLPEVTVDNIIATVESLIGQSGQIFQRSVVNTFTRLDRRFRSHDGFKIGSRVIFEGCFDPEWHSWRGYGADSAKQRIMDIERIFQVLDRENRLTEDGNRDANWLDPASLIWHIDQNRAHKRAQSEVESAFFKVRIFKNGNMHLWMTRKDLLQKVNRILAEHYGETIGDGKNNGVEEDPLENRKTTPARYFGFFPTPPDVVERVWSQIGVHQYRDKAPAVLEPSAGTGNLVHEPINRGWDVDCVEVQPHLAQGLEKLAVRRVTCADFTTLPPTPTYDIVVMNPPFDRERDIDHVTHALKFLKPDGVLVAVMSAGTEWRETKKSLAFQALMTRMNAKWRDLPEGAFAEQGTNVNTVIVTVYKDGRKQSRW